MTCPECGRRTTAGWRYDWHRLWCNLITFWGPIGWIVWLFYDPRVEKCPLCEKRMYVTSTSGCCMACYGKAIDAQSGSNFIADSDFDIKRIE